MAETKETLPCGACGRRTGIFEMRFNQSKDRLVCQECFAKGQSRT